MFARTLEAPTFPPGGLRLVKPGPEHAALSLGWVRDPDVTRYMGADFSGASMATETTRVLDLLSSTDTFGWIIEVEGRPIGAIEINRIGQTSQTYGVKGANFSTLIGDKAWWGKHVAPTAKRLIMDWGFAEGGFELFVGRSQSPNERSWRSLEHLGFEYQETQSEMLRGRTVEWRVYVMTKSRWLKVR